MENKEKDTIHRTPNPDCPACQQKLRHNPEEWKQYHPLAGSGFARQGGQK